MSLEDESPVRAVELCIACEAEEATGTYWNNMRLCAQCGNDLMGSDEYEAAHQARSALPWDAPEVERMAPYQQAAKAWLLARRLELGRNAA